MIASASSSQKRMSISHLNTNGVAHSSQNFAWSGFSWRHSGQVMAGD